MPAAFNCRGRSRRRPRVVAAKRLSDLLEAWDVWRLPGPSSEAAIDLGPPVSHWVGQWPSGTPGPPPPGVRGLGRLVPGWGPTACWWLLATRCGPPSNQKRHAVRTSASDAHTSAIGLPLLATPLLWRGAPCGFPRRRSRKGTRHPRRPVRSAGPAMPGAARPRSRPPGRCPGRRRRSWPISKGQVALANETLPRRPPWRCRRRMLPPLGRRRAYCSSPALLRKRYRSSALASGHWRGPPPTPCPLPGAGAAMHPRERAGLPELRLASDRARSPTGSADPGPTSVTASTRASTTSAPKMARGSWLLARTSSSISPARYSACGQEPMPGHLTNRAADGGRIGCPAPGSPERPMRRAG